MGALVESGHFKDPYFGMNLRSIPGTTYPIGHRFTLLPMPEDSPYKPSWWYRKELVVPEGLAGRSLALHFDGINYRANVWVNGTRIAHDKEVVGAFRRYEFDVTPLLRAGRKAAVAVEVFAPEPTDLAFMWVDWNPTPADKNMGLWGDVYLTDSGPLALRRPARGQPSSTCRRSRPRTSPSPPRSGTRRIARRPACCGEPSRASSSRRR